MPKGNLGGQRRTVTCFCGWEKQGSVREANFCFKIHQKVCPNKVTATMPEFDSKDNAFNNVSQSKNGNMAKKDGKILWVHREGIVTEEFVKGI